MLDPKMKIMSSLSEEIYAEGMLYVSVLSGYQYGLVDRGQALFRIPGLGE